LAPSRGSAACRWNGKSWKRLALAARKFGYLSGIAASSATDAWAVGGTTNSSGEDSQALVLHWNGKAWNRAPGLPSVNGSLNAVTISGGNVWAAGDTSQYLGDALIMRWTGSKWYVEAAPSGSDYMSVDSIAVTASNAWAVAASGFSDYLLHWNGGVWKLVSFPLHEKYDAVYSIATGPHGTAWGVGEYSNETTSPVPLSMRWTGKAWRKVPVSVGISGLDGVGYIPGGTAWAVGYDDVSPLVMRWTGKAWAEVATPNLLNGQMQSVVATSASNAWAVGWYAPDVTDLTVIFHWNGRTWTAVLPARRADSRRGPRAPPHRWDRRCSMPRSRAASRGVRFPVDSSMTTPPWIPARIAAAVRVASRSAAISPVACMLVMPAAIWACHSPMSSATTARAPGVTRPSCVMRAFSGQCCPCWR
jgi:hypothetical protein